MAFWLDVAAFALKSLLIVAALGGLIGFVALIARRMRGGGEPDEPRLAVRSLDERYDAMRDAIEDRLVDKKGRKALAKARRKEAKAAAKAAPERAAASTFSLMPPTGRSFPRSVISPVMANSGFTGLRMSNDAKATAIVTPADGPSLGIAPAGT